MFRRPSVSAALLALAFVPTVAARTAAAQTPAPASPAPAPVPADAPAPPTIEGKIEALDQQIRIQARQAEIEKEAAAAAAATAPVVAAGAGGFEIRSADSAFRVRIRGYLHADSRYYGDDDDNRGVDTFLVRRARPILEATFFRIFDFRIMSDFGGGTAVVQDAYLDARFAKAFNLRAGKHKPPLGQERLLSATDILFIERALPTALAPNRDVGVQAYGDLAPWLSYNLGLFNGVVDGGSGDTDVADSKDVVGRLVFAPFKADTKSPLQTLLFGVGGSGGREVGTPAAPALAQVRSGGQLVWFRYRTDGTAPNTAVADGRRTRVTAFGQYYAGPLGLQAEYVRSQQAVRRAAVADRIAQQAWQATGSWVLTGETATGRAVAPRKAFDPSKGGWGAFEIVARANALTVDDAAFPVFANLDQAARKATAGGVGLNWYLNRNVKIAADYERTTFDRGAAAGADRPGEHAVFTRFQIAF
jgi:phosphate-selective porin OprO and OprP